MNICIISDGYPSKDRQEFVFVQQICIELTKQGHKVSVIAPESLTKRILRKLPKLPKFRQDKIGEDTIDIYAPTYISLGKYGRFFKLIRNQRNKSISKTIQSLKPKPDILYGHFWHNGFAVFDVGKKFDIPIFVACGESEISQRVKSKKEKDFTKIVKGVICVSTKNLEESKLKGLTTGENCIVIPNAVNTDIFHLMTKNDCRKQLGIDQEAFIISFVGGFIERKGPNRVAAAITKLHNNNIKSFFIGANRDGDLTSIDCKGILHCGPIPHEKIPLYLNASDIFVLPTLQEGCCNAIIEAMSCGLPIVSSNLPFNKDILDQSNAILIDPHKIEEIAQAIDSLYSDKIYRNRLAQNSLLKAKELTISKRVEKIINFITDRKNY